MDLSKLKYALVDIDGTMTDSGIYYDNSGNEFKKFTTRDAAGIHAAHFIGIKILVVTGRKCEATLRRMKELHIDFVHQGIKDKKMFLSNFMKDNSLKKENLAYIGDDLNDYPAMSLAGFIACPSDSCAEVKKISNFISEVRGGQGVIQDVFRYVLHQLNKWDDFLNTVIEAGY